jgi:mannosyltransferase PIG-V
VTQDFRTKEDDIRSDIAAGDTSARVGGGGLGYRTPTISDYFEDLRFVLGAWLASRIVVLVALLSSRPALPGSSILGRLNTAVDNWDVGWLLGIARTGYERPLQAAFFPAFPCAVHLTAALLGDALLAALLLNAVLSAAGSVMFYALARRRLRVDEARLAVLVLLFHPLSFFLTIPYTEALYLVASIGAFAIAERGPIIPAGLFAALAGATRNTGAFLAIPLSLLGWTSSRAEGPAASRRWGRTLILAAFPLAGLASFMLFTGIKFGDSLLFFRAQTFWYGHIHLSPPFVALFYDVNSWRSWIDHHLPLSLIGLFLAWRVWTRWPRAYGLLVIPPVLLSFSLSKLAITPRLHLVLFPLWLEAGALLAKVPRWLAAAILCAAAALGFFLTQEFAIGTWVD